MGVNAEIVEFVDGEDFVRVIQDAERTQSELGTAPPHFLVLLDINMPRMSGLEVLEAMDAMETNNERIMSIVMYTSSENEQDKVESMKSQLVDEYIVKPLEKETFQKLVDKYFLNAP